jgi:glycosyltransferase involved in cell wall biosynthesis
MSFNETAPAFLRKVKTIVKTCLYGCNLLFWRIRRLFSRDLVVHVYALCWNEEKILPYFLRHYGRIASKIVIYDNESTDRSVEIIRSYPNTEVISYHTGGKLNDFKYLEIKNNVWKRSRGGADWVIVVDMDEFLYHPDLAGCLKSYRQKGITISVPVGYEMISDAFPKTGGMIYDEAKLGVQYNTFDKMVLFDPNAIFEINYAPGCHKAAPKGILNFDSNRELKLLHFNLMGLDHLLERYASRKARLSEHQIKHGIGVHYLLPKDQIINWFNERRKSVTRVIP